ncbi:hypothetical protein FB45DRAFT_891708 [Roridomyces roridus]|uniref:C2 domain-containing protein n=1 Tax=Roridomyces roridus TaxID=1738132 RepID=A0AAD7CEG3_9AGAR|nr:hypothetical protein FB45DRAFT_891708 [Roridomyces roridus]
MEDTERWSCTVVRAHGLHLMRPEKSWRPIVTVEIDQTQQHETVLGSDGQNINLKASFLLKEATLSSQVEVKIFHRSHSKKKGKKRILVGAASCSLREMYKKHGTEPKLELRLQCQTPTKRSVASRGRPQNGALIHLRLYPPSSVATVASPSQEDDGYCSSSAGSSSPSEDDSDTLHDHASVSELSPIQGLRRRRRVRPFCANSDEEAQSYSEEYDSEENNRLMFGGPSFDEEDEEEEELMRPRTPVKKSFNPIQWIMAGSFLPQHTVQTPAPPPDPGAMNFFERVLTTFTIYDELRRARCDDDFERVFKRLQSEWMWNATILMALAGVDITIFSLSPDSLFAINYMSRSVVAASSIASGLGVICAIWLLFWYAWVDLGTFIIRARDVMSTPTSPSYFFFSLSARLPSILTLTSSLSLMSFMTLVAFSVWPTAVIVGCFLVGLLMGLQFLVFAVVWVVRTVRRGVRCVLGLIGFGSGSGAGAGTATRKEEVGGEEMTEREEEEEKEKC